MSTQQLVQNSMLMALQEQVRDVAQQLRAGMDIAPAQRLRLEGFAAALIANGTDIDQLESLCAAAGAGVMTLTRAGDTLHFDCWQQRAPVYPTTAD